MLKILKFIPLLLFPTIILANISVCFTPQENCTQQIVDKITSAKTSLEIQAYSFTSRPIISAIVKAQERGVKTKIILDKSQRAGFGYYAVKTKGINPLIDNKVRIAHNKVIIIDGSLVITGSFNFSRAAQYYNAENVVFIEDKEIAKRYEENFNYRRGENK